MYLNIMRPLISLFNSMFLLMSHDEVLPYSDRNQIATLQQCCVPKAVET